MLEQQVKEAQLRLRREVADAALAAAEQLLRRGMTPADQQRFVANFVSDVEHEPAPAAAASGPASGRTV